MPPSAAGATLVVFGDVYVTSGACGLLFDLVRPVVHVQYIHDSYKGPNT